MPHTRLAPVMPTSNISIMSSFIFKVFGQKGRRLWEIYIARRKAFTPVLRRLTKRYLSTVIAVENSKFSSMSAGNPPGPVQLFRKAGHYTRTIVFIDESHTSKSAADMMNQENGDECRHEFCGVWACQIFRRGREVSLIDRLFMLGSPEDMVNGTLGHHFSSSIVSILAIIEPKKKNAIFLSYQMSLQQIIGISNNSKKCVKVVKWDTLIEALKTKNFVKDQRRQEESKGSDQDTVRKSLADKLESFRILKCLNTNSQQQHGDNQLRSKLVEYKQSGIWQSKKLSLRNELDLNDFFVFNNIKLQHRQCQ
ncbi:hypothetical protein G9A89_017144 [Geosiphon pyriformis]|nr:hypothetical protein G9A89_017144 [Geosiphon pyriformis]